MDNLLDRAEVDLLKSQEINLDYILELIFDNNKKVKTKAALVEEVRRAIRASLGNRAKESLLVDFINQTDLSQFVDKASVIEAFFRRPCKTQINAGRWLEMNFAGATKSGHPAKPEQQ